MGQIDFFTLDGEYLRSVKFRDISDYKHEFLKESKFWEDTEYQIESLDSKKGLIFALNFNNKAKGFYDGQRDNDIKVQVFDWKGTPIKEYHLEDILVESFVVDPLHNRIYAYAPEVELHNLIYFDM